MCKSVKQLAIVGRESESSENTQVSAANAAVAKVERMRTIFIIENLSVVISKVVDVREEIAREAEAFILLICISCTQQT